MSSCGLTSDEAAKRLKEFGFNALPEKKQSALVKFMSSFWGPIPWMIEAAAILSAIVQHWWDLAIIVTMLMINAIVSFWQEYKADNAIQLLKSKLALSARALRDGKWRDIPARELVPGDKVFLRLGNIIPADIQLESGDYLNIDQSALTGESLPVEKRVGETAYSGSIVRLGEMHGTVTATGSKTYFGRTAGLVEKAGNSSHFQRAVINIGNFLILVTIALVALILTVALFRHTPFLETLQFTLILTVAAIPVALPAVLSVTMAVGAEKLAKMKAIVSRLVAIEELAGMNILCADKTGTLTQNKLNVGELWNAQNIKAPSLLLEAALASSVESNDSIDNAVLEAAGTVPQKYELVHLEPFDPVKKHTLVEIREDNTTYKLAKGAPQVIIHMCGGNKEATAQVEVFATKGYRTIAVARNDGKTWQLRGLISLFDPPREDASITLEEAHKMGIEIKMITGDHTAIAKQIAATLHLGKQITSAHDLFDKEISEEKFGQTLDVADGVAEVFPEHKYRIVKYLQHRGEIVGMTGDGVNDAPALKQADVGIAVSGATDAARAAADLSLTASGISVVIAAIAEARRIFHRMTSYATFRIAETIRVLLFMTLSILIFDFYPVTAVMIVLLALLNDFPIMMIAFDNAQVTEKPVRWDMHRVLTVATTLGFTGVTSTFLLFWYAEHTLQLSREVIQTLIFLKLLVAGHMTLYITRSYGWFWQKPFPSIKLFITVEATQIIGTFAAVYGWFMQPVGWNYALAIWGYAILCFMINDFVKVWLIRRLKLAAPEHKAHLNRAEQHVNIGK